MKNYSDALTALRPNSTWTANEDSFKWFDSVEDCPSEEDIIQKIAELNYLDEVKEYQTLRKADYPSYDEQLDMMYWDNINGTTNWADTVSAIKAKHPKAEVDETELASRKAQALFDYQLKMYAESIERLNQYVVADGRVEQETTNVIGQRPDLDSEGNLVLNDANEIVYVDVFEILPAIDPVPATVIEYDDLNQIEVENPLITKDNEERAAAQAIVDATPQEVIDAYNAEV